MSKMIQMRNVPDELHRKLKARAAMAGMTLSDYLLREVRHIAERPTMEEMMKRIEAAGPVVTSITSAQAVREEREKRGRR